MTPDEALRFTRVIASLSILTLVVGSIAALFMLQLRTTSLIDLSGFLAFAVLGPTNVISMMLNAIFWFIRRAPKWLEHQAYLQRQGVKETIRLTLRHVGKYTAVIPAMGCGGAGHVATSSVARSARR